MAAYPDTELFRGFRHYQNLRTGIFDIKTWIPENICGVGWNGTGDPWGGDKRGISIPNTWIHHFIPATSSNFTYSFCRWDNPNILYGNINNLY
jgi:hypothetical protein